MKFNFDFQIYKFLLYIFLMVFITVFWKHRKPRTVIRSRNRQAVIDEDGRRASRCRSMRATAANDHKRASVTVIVKVISQ